MNEGAYSTTSVRHFLRQIFFIPVGDLASNPSDPLPNDAHISQTTPTVFSLLDLNKFYLYEILHTHILLSLTPLTATPIVISEMLKCE